MKTILLAIMLNVALIIPTSAQVDSVHWDNISSPHTFYLKIQVNQGNQIKLIDQYLQNDTVFLDFIFSDCAAPLSMYYYD